MVRWLDPLLPEEQDRLKGRLRELRDAKPQGWSVVWRGNEISVRPPDRSLGKFSITPAHNGTWRAAFFCWELNVSNKQAYFPDGGDAALQLIIWMHEEVREPLRHVSSV